MKLFCIKTSLIQMNKASDINCNRKLEPILSKKCLVFSQHGFSTGLSALRCCVADLPWNRSRKKK